MEIDPILMNQVLSVIAIITLGLGAALIVYLYDAYRHVKEESLLLLIYGLFVLVVGIVLTDLTSIFTSDLFWIFWSELFSRLLVIIGIIVIIYSILKE
ncbi:hypothetical protein F1737_06095 [Methanoplanus sp. FWC-SCC4]|uniref:Uncharacterized protein n=1 Tax=Methanochimaera problematica TaxID=2609417 RepID=A0AA97FBE0_9EURY|nr:hypothetical protein [Methanoplanus sp. FWC-SCC4]WOF16315.1 hypothetical protein F1737_06095 [Methanoplanus sp. FWC-SCC4]